MMLNKLRGGIAATALALLAAALPAAGDDFYKGKTINMYVAGDAGDGYDVYARLLVTHYTRHIPGNPTFIVRNMPGAGTLKAANYVYEVAPKDGTAMGTVEIGRAHV